MNKKETMLKNLSAAQFKLWEIHLYLDTHPWDLQMLEAHSKAEMRYKVLRNEFEENFFGLTPASSQGVDWLKGPWPWELEECDC